MTKVAENSGKKGRGGSKPGERRGGRKKGTPNRVTREFRETVRLLLEENSENVSRWLTQVAEGVPAKGDQKGRDPDPARALDLLVRLAEFAAPKLQRTEHVGEEGGPILTHEVSDIDLARRVAFILESAVKRGS